MTIHRLLAMLFVALLLVPSITRAQEKGNDLHYVLTRLDDPNPVVRESAFQVCRMASADGIKLIEQDLAAKPDKPSASARQTLEQIIHQQHVVRAQMDAASEARRRWLRKTTIDAYDAIGSKNPAWNERARDAIILFYKPNRTVEEERRMHPDMDGGAIAKCDDALFNYVRNVWSIPVHAGYGSMATGWLFLGAQGLEASKYPASRKIMGYASFFDGVSEEAQYDQKSPLRERENVEHFRDAMIALIPDYLHEEDAPHAKLISAAISCLNASVAAGIDRKVSFDLLNNTFPHDLPESAEMLIFKGEFLINYAWDARGTGWSNSVTDEGAKLFAQRISDASDTLQAAWASDPQAFGAWAASSMITVCMAQGAPDQTRELWFKRALESNPDNSYACSVELNAIDPRWIGDTGIDKLGQLGRMCELSGNDGAGITLIAASAQRALAGSTVYSDGLHYNRDYIKRPEVWATISRVYVSYLKEVPADRGSRDYFISLAAAADHWDVVKDQLPYIEGYPNPLSYWYDTEDFEKVKKLMTDRYK
jgi:hypothetical protein